MNEFSKRLLLQVSVGVKAANCSGFVCNFKKLLHSTTAITISRFEEMNSAVPGVFPSISEACPWTTLDLVTYLHMINFKSSVTKI